MFRSFITTQIISNEERNDAIRRVKCLEESGLLIKGVEAKEQNGGFLGMLLGTVGASLLGNLLTGKDKIRAQLQQDKIFNAGSSFNKVRNTIAISKWT